MKTLATFKPLNIFAVALMLVGAYLLGTSVGRASAPDDCRNAVATSQPYLLAGSDMTDSSSTMAAYLVESSICLAN